MPPADPNAVTSVDWLNIHNWLTLLWIYFPLVIGFAFSMLIAHAFIPSLVITGHLPPGAQRVRIPLTVVGVALVIAAAIIMFFVVILTPQALSNIYDRLLI